MQHGLERVVDLNTGAQSIRVVLETDGSNHELLNINVGVCVRTTVEDVHHGEREARGRWDHPDTCRGEGLRTLRQP